MMEEEVNQDDIDQLYDQINSLRTENEKQSKTISSFSAVNKDSNLISIQLDPNEVLARLERFYRGEYIVSDGQGGTDLATPEDENLIPLNDYGVGMMMEIVSKYIDKLTFLSYYNEERIYEILADLGDELTLLIYCNYEKMGMDTYAKKTRFRIIIVTTLHIIESSYRRSIDGRTLTEVNQSRIVSQSDSLGRPVMNQRREGPIGRFFNRRNWR